MPKDLGMSKKRISSERKKSVPQGENSDSPEQKFYEILKKVTEKPQPFCRYTAETLWNDEYISRQMLRFHLDENIGAASRRRDFIENSAVWIAERFKLTKNSKVIDFGCGPGWYTTRFARCGAQVTGIDFSRRSIAYAKETAEREGLTIDYQYADYLKFDIDRRFDLITLIFCDLCPLSPDQRRTLLQTFCRLLRDGGHILLDVATLPMLSKRQETIELGFRLDNGFWAAGDYFGLKQVFKYPAECVSLDKYTIFEPNRIWEVFNWLQYFDRDMLAAEFASAGLKITTCYGDVAGSPFSPEKDEFAVVATKA